MRSGKKDYRTLSVILSIAIIFVLVVFAGSQGEAKDNSEKRSVKEVRKEENSKTAIPSYAQVSSLYQEGYAESEVNIDMGTALDGDHHSIQLSNYAQEQGLLWNQESSPFCSFSFECEAGLYSVEFSYIPMNESDMDIIANVKIDEETLFEELETVELPRMWVAESDNYYDDKGNEYASYLIQKEEVSTASIRDRDGLYSDDLLIELSEGQHTLSLQYVSGSMLLIGIELIPAQELPSYEEYRSQYETEEYSGESITIQAENADSRSSREIPSYTHNDASMTPYTPGKKRINAFGGGYWYEGNSSATWKLDVPEDGWYKLSMRFIQDNDGLISYRQILIDGEVPFEEMNAYPFGYTNKFYTEAIGGDEPYLFYLEEGTHTLTMRAVSGEMKEPVCQLEELGVAIGLLVSDIQTITGTSPDPNFDYELDKKMPNLIEELELYENNLIAIADEITEICGTSPAITTTLYSDADVIDSLIKNTRKIPENVSLITTIQGDVNDAMSTIKIQSLGIDWISLQSPSEELYQPKASVWDTLGLMVSDFIESFQSDDDSEEKEENTIDLWVARDSEWGDILQRMISEEFEPKYEIKVNVNMLPSGYTTVVNGASPLLLSVVSGNTPDIAMGCDSDTPIELAIRGQLADLSQFSDFEEVAECFPETTIQALSYGDGCYGLPETIEIPIMVYRTDVFEQNDLKVPDTWEELWRYTLPQLAQIDGNFYMGSSSMDMYATFLYQNGGDFYDESGECTLNTDSAIEAFEQWIKCFVQYNVPQSANFYNEMRTGTLPIGVCSLDEYMQLLTYAGELTGKLGIAPIPGTEQEDGTIARYGAGSVGSSITSAIVFEDSDKQDECWTFLKWWTSAEVQQRFATSVEARVGATGRWFSANKDAFYALPWEQQALEIIEDWMPWYRNTYNVLGGYYTSRSITNAWTRTVLSGVDARDSIEQSYEEISLQIERKKEEYGEEP